MSGRWQAAQSSANQQPHRGQASTQGVSHPRCHDSPRERQRGQYRQRALSLLSAAESVGGSSTKCEKPTPSGPSSRRTSPVETLFASASRSTWEHGPTSGALLGLANGREGRREDGRLTRAVSLITACGPWQQPCGEGTCRRRPACRKVRQVASKGAAAPWDGTD